MTEHDEIVRALDERAERGTRRDAEAVVAAAWQVHETPIALHGHRRTRRHTWLAATAAVAVTVAILVWLRPQPAPDKVDTGGTTTTTAAPPAVWQQVASLEISDRQPSAAAPTIWTGKELILVGGLKRPGDVWGTFAAMAESPALDPTTGSLRLIAPPPVPLRAVAVSAVWTGQEILVASSGEPAPGQSIGNWLGFAYNPTSDTWRAITMPASPLYDLYRADDQILAVTTATVERYDTATDRWTELGKSHDRGPEGIFEPRPVVWTGRRLLAVGPKTTALFSRDAAGPTELSPAPFEAKFAAWTGSHALIYGSDVYMGGPSRIGIGPARLARFDPAANRWEERASAPPDHTAASHAMAWADGRLVTWNGLVSSPRPSATDTRPNPSYEGTVYDPVTDAWSRAPRLPEGTGWALSGTGVGNRIHTWTVDTRVPDPAFPTDPAASYTFTLTAVSWTLPPR
jgi:hypothetical protein